MSSSAAIRVLLLEDDAIGRWGVRRSLEASGCVVTEAETAARAETLWLNGSFDAVVADHRLPDGFGADLVERMRRQGRTEPVIYLSAETEEVPAARREALRLHAVLSKPVDLRALAGALEKLASAAGRGGPAPHEDTVGRFRVVPGGVHLDREAVGRLADSCRDTPWVAVEAGVVVHTQPSAWSALGEWADRCVEAGGRLCLVGANPDIEREMRFYRLHLRIDLVTDRDALAAAGRRVTAVCERAAVLGSVLAGPDS